MSRFWQKTQESAYCRPEQKGWRELCVQFAKPDDHNTVALSIYIYIYHFFANSDLHQFPSPSFLRLSNPSSNFSLSSPKCCTKRALRKFAAVPPLKPPKLLAAVLPGTSSWITRFTCRLSFVVFQALSMLQNATP